MTKLTLSTHPFLLGFEQLERLVERTAKSEMGGYPPYNIEQTSERSFRITLAVAGFAEEELQITLEDRQLVVRGRQGEVDEGRVFLHRSSRSFPTISSLPTCARSRWRRRARVGMPSKPLPSS